MEREFECKALAEDALAKPVARCEERGARSELGGEVAGGVEFAGLAEGGEGFEDFLDAFDALGGGTAEGFGDVGGRGAGGEGGESGVDGAGLGGERFWPVRGAKSEFRGASARFASGLFGFRTLPWPLPKREGNRVLAGGVLEVGAEVADEATLFFGGTLVVEGDEAGEDFVVREVGGLAVGVKKFKTAQLIVERGSIYNSLASKLKRIIAQA